MNVPDYVKENLYLPYFRRLNSRARAQQILLGLGIGLMMAGILAAWWLWNRKEAPASEG